MEAEQISTEPVAAEEVVTEAPGWQGMLLDAAPARVAGREREVATATEGMEIAPISRRLMAAMVDGCCIGAALVGFATVASYISGPELQAMSKPMLAGAVVFTFAIAALLYQLLFFSLNEATPGMRYARIGLCTLRMRIRRGSRCVFSASAVAGAGGLSAGVGAAVGAAR